MEQLRKLGESGFAVMGGTEPKFSAPVVAAVPPSGWGSPGRSLTHVDEGSRRMRLSREAGSGNRKAFLFLYYHVSYCSPCTQCHTHVTPRCLTPDHTHVPRATHTPQVTYCIEAHILPTYRRALTRCTSAHPQTTHSTLTL